MAWRDQLHDPPSLVVAFAFGLLHGFGFASGLTTMGLPQAEIPLALLLFNVGVEVGQFFFVALSSCSAGVPDLQIRWPWRGGPPGYAIGRWAPTGRSSARSSC